MTSDLIKARQLLRTVGPVARIAIVQAKGSVPRDCGTDMWVWSDGQSGTIGGGALEWEATKNARRLLREETTQAPMLSHHPLGPSLGQCCGGAVTLQTQAFKCVEELPLSQETYSDQGESAGIKGQNAALWVYGAGHVGRAIVATLAPLEQFAMYWVDTHSDRFPGFIPTGVEQVVATDPAAIVPHSGRNVSHLILTYSHHLDLALCHAVLSHGFADAGLIGSQTKWARFRKKLRQLGHQDAQINRITCPIGDPALGKHPQAIAVGVVAALLTGANQQATVREAAI